MWPFGVPPEIISGDLYSGPGSAALLAASTAWGHLAAELESTAASYGSVISGLTSDWLGPTSNRMATAAAPYVSWMTTTAAQAEQVSSQVKAAAAAFENAHGMAVNPAVIAANRAQLMTLVSTNILGQNTGLIALNEAHYLEMWAQDVLTMLTYAGSAQTTTKLPDQTSPPTIAPNALMAAPQGVAAATQSVSTSGITNVLGNLGNLGGLGDIFGQANAGLNSLFAPLAQIPLLGPSLADPTALVTNYGSTGLRFATTPMSSLMSMMMRSGTTGATTAGARAATGGSTSLIGGINQLIDARLTPMLGTLTNHITSWGQSVSAQVGHATSLGSMSVPPGWTSGASSAIRAAPILPNTSVAAAPMASSGLAASPFTHAMTGAMAGRGMGGVASKVGTKIAPKGR